MSEELKQITSRSVYGGTELCAGINEKNGLNNSVKSISSQTCKAENHPEQDRERDEDAMGANCQTQKYVQLFVQVLPIMQLGHIAAKA